MAGGRPTLYTPEMCEAVIALMEQGYSITASAGIIGVSRETFRNWSEAHPEFLGALNLGRASRLAFWEGELIKGELPPTNCVFALKNADNVEWRDRREIAGDPEKPLKVEHGGSAVEALAAIVNAVAARKDEGE